MKSEAPWSPEEVTSINDFQESGVMHPFTCGSGQRTDASHNHQGGTLVATTNGWICPYCSYTQDWCHEFMANGLWREMQRKQDEWTRKAEIGILAEEMQEDYSSRRDTDSPVSFERFAELAIKHMGGE